VGPGSDLRVQGRTSGSKEGLAGPGGSVQMASNLSSVGYAYA